MAAFDFGKRISWWLKTFLVTGFILMAIWGIVEVGGLVLRDARLLRCDDNLRRLGKALIDYKERNKCLPTYITALYPDYIDDKEVFRCPADHTHGEAGAFPRWMRFTEDSRVQPNWIEELGYADLDGPTLIPWDHTGENGEAIEGDKDTFRCSYFYRFNDYPSDIEDLESAVTWQQLSSQQAREYGDRTPVIRCFWHLPEYAEISDEPTTNLVYNLIGARRYPRDWRPKRK